MEPIATQSRPTHCVFRRGDVWCGLPAEAVRKVMPRPVLVRVPRSAPVLVGLCHEGGSFLPVLSLDTALGASSLPEEPLMLVIDDRQGPWGLLIDEIASLTHLESSTAPESEGAPGWSSALIGWATYRNNVVRLFDAVRFREVTEGELCGGWPAAAPVMLAEPIRRASESKRSKTSAESKSTAPA